MIEKISQLTNQLKALPLYHTFASQVGVTGAVIAGAAVAIAPKFSATNFWKGCVKYDAEYIFYIGEMLRYCLDAPPGEYDKKHKIKGTLVNNVWIVKFLYKQLLII